MCVRLRGAAWTALGSPTPTPLLTSLCHLMAYFLRIISKWEVTQNRLYCVCVGDSRDPILLVEMVGTGGQKARKRIRRSRGGVRPWGASPRGSPATMCLAVFPEGTKWQRPARSSCWEWRFLQPGQNTLRVFVEDVGSAGGTKLAQEKNKNHLLTHCSRKLLI